MKFEETIRTELERLNQTKTFKKETVIESEQGPVVRDEEPDANERPQRAARKHLLIEEGHSPLSASRASYTNSMRAIGALSPWRGPSLRIRV